MNFNNKNKFLLYLPIPIIAYPPNLPTILSTQSYSRLASSGTKNRMTTLCLHESDE